MNMVNKIIILIIMIVIINHLMNGEILNKIRRIFTIFNTEKFIEGIDTNKKIVDSNLHQVPYESQNNINEINDETYRLYRFINNMVTTNINIYELTASRGKKIKASNELKKEIIVHLERIFNCSGYKFLNLKLIDQINYYENPRGKELESFNFSSDIFYYNKLIGSFVINIESFLREDNFYQNHSKYGFFTIINIKLVDKIYPKCVNNEKKNISGYKLESSPRNQSHIKDQINPTKNQQHAIERNNKNNTKMNESFNNHFVPTENFNELFIKPQSNSEAFINDSENSLIPTINEISSKEYS